MSETLLDVLTWNAATGDYRVPDDILDAHIYGGDTDSISIVPAEVEEAFARAMVAAASGLDETDEEWDETMQGMWGETYAEAVARFKERAPAVLTAVLGKTRVAKEVVAYVAKAKLDLQLPHGAAHIPIGPVDEVFSVAILEDEHE